MNVTYHNLPDTELTVRPYIPQDAVMFFNALDANRDHMKLVGVTKQSPTKDQVIELVSNRVNLTPNLPTHFGAWIGSNFVGNVHFKPVLANDLPEELSSAAKELLAAPDTFELNYWRDKRFPRSVLQLSGQDASKSYMDNVVRIAVKSYLHSRNEGVNIIAFVEKNNRASLALMNRLAQTAILGTHPHFDDLCQEGHYYRVELT